jgi:hypothetical protein
MTEAALRLYESWKGPLKDILTDVRKLFVDINKEIDMNSVYLTRFFGWVRDKFRESIGYGKMLLSGAKLLYQEYNEPGSTKSTPYKRDPLSSYGYNLVVPDDVPFSADYRAAGEIQTKAKDDGLGSLSSAKTEAKDLGDFLNATASDVFDEMRENASKAGEALWKIAQEKKIALGQMWTDMGKSFGTDFMDVIAQKLAGFEVSWSSMWQNMKYQMIKTFMATGQLDIGGMLGGMLGGGGLGGLFGGRSGGGAITGPGTGMLATGGGMSAMGSSMSWAGPLALAGGVLSSAFKADTRVEIDKRQAAADYQAQIDAGREQIAELIQQANMGELGNDAALRDAIAGFQFQDVEQRLNEFGSGGGFSRHTVQQYLITNEEAVKSQMQRFQELMSRVQGTKQFEQAARENTFTGAGYMTVNNFSNIVQGNQVVNDAAMNDLARDFGRRMIKLGLVAAGTV